MSIYISADQWRNRIETKYPTLEVLSEIYNSKQSTQFRCKNCGNEFIRAVENVIYKNWVCKCEESKVNVNPSGTTKKMHQEFLNDIKSRPIEPVEKYINNATKIKFRCLIDGHKWDALPKNILKGTGCPKCAIKRQSDQRKGQTPVKHILYQDQVGKVREHRKKQIERNKEIDKDIKNHFNLEIDFG